MNDLVLLSEWQASQIEIWLPVPCFEGYDVSNQGRVRSWWNHRSPNKRITPVLLQPWPNKKGYLNVRLKGKALLVHQVVAMAFIPDPDEKFFCNHLTGQKSNNWTGNLERATNKENCDHAHRHGLMPVRPVGERHQNSLLTNDQVRYIRRRYAEGNIVQRQLAAQFGVAGQTISAIISGASWRGVR